MAASRARTLDWPGQGRVGSEDRAAVAWATDREVMTGCPGPARSVASSSSYLPKGRTFTRWSSDQQDTTEVASIVSWPGARGTEEIDATPHGHASRAHPRP